MLRADPAADAVEATPMLRRTVLDRVAVEGQDVPTVADRTDSNLSGSAGRRRLGRFALISVAVAVVVAVAVTAAAIALGREHDPGPTSRPVSALYGLRWSDPRSDGSAIFRPGQVELSDGCSETVYRLNVAADRLEVGAKGTIVRSCGGGGIGPGPGQSGHEEYVRRVHALTLFQAVFASSPTWTIDSATLTLTAPSGASVHLTATAVVPAQLPATSWTLDVVGTLHSTGLSGAFEGPTLDFGTNGSFRATDTCDTLTGTADVTAHEITFKSVQRTHHKCPLSNRPEAIETIDTMLTSTVEYTLFDDSLLLTLPRTHGMLEYRST